MSPIGDVDDRDPLVATAAVRFVPWARGGLRNCEDIPKDRRVAREEGHVYAETDALGDDDNAAVCEPEVGIVFDQSSVHRGGVEVV